MLRQFGSLDLELALSPGGTSAGRALAYPPLQLSRLRRDFAPWPEAASFTLLHLGGVLDGDCYQVAVTLAPGAVAHLTSAAATLVHPAPSCPATLTTTIRLGADARLAYLPLPLILFRDADLVQQLRVELAPGSVALLLDCLVGGRLAMGESLRFRRYQSRLDVVDDHGRLLLAERTDLQPAQMPFAAPGLLGGATAVASFYLLAPGRCLDAATARLWSLIKEAGLDAALGSLPNGAGLLLRALGDDGMRLWRSLEQFARLLSADSQLIG